MTWRRTLRNMLVIVLLAIALIYWGLVVLGFVEVHSPIGEWYKVIGRPALFLPDLIAYFVIGATIGTPTGLLFPCHPIRVAVLLALIWEGFTLYAIATMNIPGLQWWVFIADAVTVLCFLPLFAYLGANLRRRLFPSTGTQRTGHFPSGPGSTR